MNGFVKVNGRAPDGVMMGAELDKIAKSFKIEELDALLVKWMPGLQVVAVVTAFLPEPLRTLRCRSRSACVRARELPEDRRWTISLKRFRSSAAS